MGILRMLHLLVLPCILLLIPSEVTPANILFFHGVSSYSHRVQTMPLAVALSERGHQITYITPYRPKEPHPNITELVSKKMSDQVDVFMTDYDITIRVRNEMQPMHSTVFPFAVLTCEALLSSPELQGLLKQNQTFDMFVIDNCFAECGLALASYMGVKKVIIFNTVVPLPYEYDAYGYLPESSAIPEFEINPFSTPMGFFERVSNALMSLQWRFTHYFYTMEMDAMVRNYLPDPNMPFIGDLQRNASLVFFTGDVITDLPRAVPPFFVNVAGTHCKDSKKSLPKEMEAFVNSTQVGKRDDDGFVYISLGSLVVSSNLPDNIKQIFFDVIKAFPTVKFMWKWNGPFPEDIPENLYLSKWFPQVDVLGHPKIKGFITQGGRPSAMEALYLGVPMISFPILGDQDLNANRMSDMGAAIKLEIGTFTFEELRDAVQKVVYDSRVKAKMTQLQKVFRDRPMTPVETGVWWMEYVLRSEDTSHLRPAGNYQYWFVRRQIDVWAFLTVAVLGVGLSILLVGWKLLTFIMPNGQESTKLKKA